MIIKTMQLHYAPNSFQHILASVLEGMLPGDWDLEMAPYGGTFDQVNTDPRTVLRVYLPKGKEGSSGVTYEVSPNVSYSELNENVNWLVDLATGR